MTAAKFKAWRARHGLTQVQAASLLGVALFTIKSWEAGRYAVSGPAAYLCAVADRVGTALLMDIAAREAA